MQNRDNLQNSFDLKLFFLNCIKKLWVVCLAMVLGSVLVGGIYFVKNVTLAGAVPYQVTNKYYLTYEVDPSDQLTYSYFAGYTWTDFLQADACIERITASLKESGITGKTAAEIRESYGAKLESDLRVLYVTVTGVDSTYVSALSAALEQEMTLFPEEHREIAETSLMTTGEVALAQTDIRTFRAFVLGAVLGGFFAVFGLGLWMIISDKCDTAIQLKNRFDYPVLGDMDKQGRISDNCVENTKATLGEARKVALITAEKHLQMEQFTKRLQEEISRREEGTGAPTEYSWTILKDVCHLPNKIELLQGQDAVVIAVQAGKNSGGAVKQLLLDLEQNHISVAATVLLETDSWLVRTYMFGK